MKNEVREEAEEGEEAEASAEDSGIVFLQQVRLPVSLAVGEHSWHADLPEVLDALLQVVLQYLPLLLLVLLRLLLVPASRGAAPLL